MPSIQHEPAGYAAWVREQRVQQLRMIVRIVAPEMERDGRIMAIKDALSPIVPNVTPARWTGILSGELFLKNSKSDDLLPLQKAVAKAVSDEDPELRSAIQGLSDKIQWEFLESPSRETKQKWIELIVASSDAKPRESGSTPQPPHKRRQAVSSLSSDPNTDTTPLATLVIPHNAILITTAETTVLINPKDRTSIKIERGKRGTTIYIPNVDTFE